MVIIFIDQYDLKSFFIQFIDQFQPSETASYNDDPLFVGIRYIKTHSLLIFTSTVKTSGLADKFFRSDKRVKRRDRRGR